MTIIIYFILKTQPELLKIKLLYLTHIFIALSHLHSSCDHVTVYRGLTEPGVPWHSPACIRVPIHPRTCRTKTGEYTSEYVFPCLSTSPCPGYTRPYTLKQNSALGRSLHLAVFHRSWSQHVPTFPGQRLQNISILVPCIYTFEKNDRG